MKQWTITRLPRQDTWQRLSLMVSPIVLALALVTPAFLQAQARVATKPGISKTKRQPTRSSKTKTVPAKPVDEITRLRAEFVKATNDYKVSLEKLRVSYEKSVGTAEVKLAKSKELFAAGLISRREVEADEAAVVQAKDKVAEVNGRMTALTPRLPTPSSKRKQKRHLQRLSRFRKAAW